MTGVRPEEAMSFYEEDEDPARVFARYEAAEKGRTAPPAGRPSQRPDLTPLRELAADLARDLRKLRPGARLALALRHLADAIGSRLRVH